MKNLKAIAGIAAIFILGVMTGVFGTSLVVKHRIDVFHEKGPPPIKPMFKKRIIDRLDLNPPQREAVEKILDELQIQIREMRQDFHPKIKAAFDASFERIKEFLDDAQKKKMEKLLEELPDHFPPHRRFRDRNCDSFDAHHKMAPPSPDEKPIYPKF
jgi:hypothetical protein